jgi:hypothetical protein
VRADDVIQAFVAALEGDAALITALGGEFIYRAGANRAPQIPSVEWRRITGTKAESTEPVTFQIDVWARGYAAAVAIEERLDAVLNREGGLVTLNGLTMFAAMEDYRDHEDPEPGVVHTSQDYRFEPAKG